MNDDTNMINAIKEYIYNIDEPECWWPKSEFNRVSYKKWAANEVLIFVLSHTDWTPTRSVEEFKYAMAKYMYKPTYQQDVTEIFSIAYETADDISDILTAMLY